MRLAEREIAVRPARAGDRDAIVRLIAGMGGHEEIARGIDPLRRLGALLEAHEARVLVAEVEGRIVGYAELQARPSSIEDRIEGWLGALAVEEAIRGHGVGERLVRAADEAAAMLGCDVMVLESSLARDGAHAFYRRLGFGEKAPALRFVRRCVGPPPDAPLAERFLAAAARAAAAVWAAIAGLQDAEPVGMGADGAPTEAADAAAEAAALAELRVLGIPIISEESGVVGEVPRCEHPWISLDPLDGSRNFRARYAPWGTAIGLIADGVPLAGYVADHASGTRWWSDGASASRDGNRIATRRGGLAGVPSPRRGEVPRAPGNFTRVRVSGSTAIDLCRVGDGSLAAFVAISRAVTHVHDLAGPYAVIRAAGGSILDAGGSPPRLVSDPSLVIPLVAAADEALAREILRTATSPTA